MSPIASSALVEAGIAAFRDRQFSVAVQHLQTVLDAEPQNWRARLYLAMSHFQSNDPLLALHHFRFLINNCTDAEIRQKSEGAIRAIGKIDESKMPEMSCNIKLPSSMVRPQPKPPEDKEELEWVSTEAESGISRTGRGYSSDR